MQSNDPLLMIFELHIFVGWTAHFAIWTAQIGWTARLKYALPCMGRPTPLPFGLLPSVRVRPGGSLIDGMPALERERCMMSLMVLCRGILPKPREQDNPWLPLASIRAPQAHMCGSHIATPRRKPTATRTSSSSSLSPHAVIGKA